MPNKCPERGMPRLRVVSNFGDGDCEAGEIHTHARKFEEMRREGSAENSRLLEISRAGVYFVRPTIAIAKIRGYSQPRNFACPPQSSPPQSPSPKLETTSSLLVAMFALDYKQSLFALRDCQARKAKSSGTQIACCVEK